MKGRASAAVTALWSAMALALCRCAAPAVSAAAPALCGPFGDPPAIVSGADKPDCPRGTTLGPWKDANGNDRYACLWEPDRVASKGRLPMLIYLHPSLFGPKTVAKTDLLRYQDIIGLSEGSAGYIVLAPMGRKTLHHYPRPDEKGLGWDTWYRQFNPAGDVTVNQARYRLNMDAAAIDHFTALELSTGKVDPDRVYVIGWSNGAAMAYLYGLNRPGIAAAVLYSAPDPFGALNDPCPQTPTAGRAVNDRQIRVFNPALPTMHVHNSCDIAGLCPNAERMARELKPLGSTLHDRIIDYFGAPVNQCARWCGVDEDGSVRPQEDPAGYSFGFIEHSRWPRQWTPLMLDFLRGHSLNQAAQTVNGGRQDEVDFAH